MDAWASNKKKAGSEARKADFNKPPTNNFALPAQVGSSTDFKAYIQAINDARTQAETLKTNVQTVIDSTEQNITNQTKAIDFARANPDAFVEWYQEQLAGVCIGGVAGAGVGAAMAWGALAAAGAAAAATPALIIVGPVVLVGVGVGKLCSSYVEKDAQHKVIEKLCRRRDKWRKAVVDLHKDLTRIEVYLRDLEAQRAQAHLERQHRLQKRVEAQQESIDFLTVDNRRLQQQLNELSRRMEDHIQRNPGQSTSSRNPLSGNNG